MAMDAAHQLLVAEDLDWRDRGSWTKVGVKETPAHDYLRILHNHGLPWFVIRRLVELTLDTRTALANYKGAGNDKEFQEQTEKMFKAYFDIANPDAAIKEAAMIRYEVMIG